MVIVNLILKTSANSEVSRERTKISAVTTEYIPSQNRKTKLVCYKIFLFADIYIRVINLCNLLGKRQMQRSIICKPTDKRVYIVKEKIDMVFQIKLTQTKEEHF